MLPSGGGAVLDAEFSPDGELVGTGDQSGQARIFNRSTGRMLHELSHDGPVEDVEFSPDGALAITASGDGTAAVWNAKTGERLETLRHDSGVTSASFSADGSLVVTSSRDGTVRVWRTTDGVPVWVLTNLGQVSQATFAARADMIVAVSGVKALILRASDGVLLRALDDQKEIKAAAVTPDGRLVLLAGDDYDAHIWDTRTGRVVAHARRPQRLPERRRALCRWLARRNGERGRLGPFMGRCQRGARRDPDGSQGSRQQRELQC